MAYTALPANYTTSSSFTATAENNVESKINIHSRSWANVVEHGADPTGGSDSAAAFQSAIDSGNPVWIPNGAYTINSALTFGTERGPTWGNLTMAAASPRLCKIYLAAGIYFLDSPRIDGCHLQRICTIGGAGFLRDYYPEFNVSSMKVIEDCRFEDYTGCAIASRNGDCPKVYIARNQFMAANDTTTIGVALHGYADRSSIRDNDFQQNRIHIKMSQAQNATIEGNDFIQLNSSPSNTRAHIWILPNYQGYYGYDTGRFYGQNSDALCVRDCKFGNENIGGNDKRILFADPVAGNFESAMPSMSGSTGWIGGIMVDRVNVVASGTNSPCVYSTTPNVYGCIFGPMMGTGHTLPIFTLLNANGYNPALNIVGPCWSGVAGMNRTNTTAEGGVLSGQSPSFLVG